MIYNIKIKIIYLKYYNNIKYSYKMKKYHTDVRIKI